MKGCPRSTFLGIPPELRLHIYDYMSLWPAPEERAHWRGAYFACRTMHTEMRGHGKLKRDIEDNVTRLQAIHITGPQPTLVAGFAQQEIGLFGLLCGITLVLPQSPHETSPFPPAFLRPIYELYLDYVNIIWDVDENWLSRRLLSDLKSLNRSALMYYITGGMINCKKVTISIPRFADAEGGRHKSTDFSMMDKYVPYNMTIVQDKNEKQVEKIFYSPTRFRPSVV